MKVKQINMILLAIGLALLIAVSFCLLDVRAAQQNLAIRNVNVSEIGMLSYEDKANQLKQQFTNTETSYENEIIKFSGNINIEEVDLLSTEYEGSEVQNFYQSEINNNSETISLSKTVFIDGEEVGFTEINLTTLTNEETGEIFIIDENGNKIDVLKELQDENVQECFFFLPFLAAITIKQIVAVVVVAVTVVTVNYVATHEAEIAAAIDTLVTGVRDGFTSFIDSIRLACGKITAVPLEEAIDITEENIEKIKERAKNRKDQYLLLGTITSKAYIQIKYKFTNLLNARIWINMGGSVWSPNSTTAAAAINKPYYAGGLEERGGAYIPGFAERHNINNVEIDGVPYDYAFYHYHPLIKKGNKYERVLHSAHSLFGLPFKNRN